jgi:hypothetical protein
MTASDEAAERAVRSSPRAGRLERLGPVDAANMRVESRGGPMHVAAVGVVDGTPLFDAPGGCGWRGCARTWTGGCTWHPACGRS